MGSDNVHEPMSGAKIGRYELRKKLAAGGMAEIYLARVTGVGGFAKDVVLKRILPQLAESEQFFRMFLDEARIAATLAHPNVVQVYDAGEADGQYYIAMEFLDGADVSTIRKHLSEKDERIALDHISYIISGVCAGLHYAHDKKGPDGLPLGIVHRDVTPQNIFVTFDGGVKLVDFGIAKASNRLSRTNYGTLKGKLAYMAPEQCQGEEVDRRSDIYALGIVLYELSTGHNPHRGGAEYAIMKEIVEGTIDPPSTLVPDYPKKLEAIVMKAIAKHPDARYQTAREMQLALETYMRDNQLEVSTLKLSDYLKPVLEAIREEQQSRSKRFADEVDAYEEYLSNKAGQKPKRRKRGEDLAAADAKAASASIDGLLEELREEDAIEERARGRQGAETIPQRPSTMVKQKPAAVAATLDVAPPIGIDGVNVRTGNKTIGIVLGVILGLGGLVGYLAVTGKLKTTNDEAAVTEPDMPEERAVPERGTIAVESAPDGAAVWRYVGRTPIRLLQVDTTRTQHFRVESDGYQTQTLEIKPDDWRGQGENKQGSTDVTLKPLSENKRGKPLPISWSAPEPATVDGKPVLGLLGIRSRPKGVGVWLYVGTTPAVTIADVSTRSGIELRFQAKGYSPSFIEVSERDFTEAGRAEVKATLSK